MSFTRSFAIRSKNKHSIVIISNAACNEFSFTLANFMLRLALLAGKLTDFDFIR